MDPDTITIASMLATAAQLALNEVAGQAVKDAYASLKSVLAGRLTSLGLIEQDPKNETFRKAAAEEMRTKDLIGDAEILAKLDALTKALEQEPPERRERLGVDIEEVHAAQDVIIRQMESVGVIRIQRVKSKTGKIQIESLKTGGSEGN
jgi:hypothetical protein